MKNWERGFDLLGNWICSENWSMILIYRYLGKWGLLEKGAHPERALIRELAVIRGNTGTKNCKMEFVFWLQLKCITFFFCFLFFFVSNSHFSWEKFLYAYSAQWERLSDRNTYVWGFPSWVNLIFVVYHLIRRSGCQYLRGPRLCTAIRDWNL